MRITIRGHNFPGRTWCSENKELDNVHVGVQEGRDPVGLVGGDATEATWPVDVRIVVDDEGRIDFRGPVVHGKRGERFLYLTWGDVERDGTFKMFRRAKLMLDADVSELVTTAEERGKDVVATVDLTDGCGGPRCARVKPPALVWSLG